MSRLGPLLRHMAFDELNLAAFARWIGNRGTAQFQLVWKNLAEGHWQRWLRLTEAQFLAFHLPRASEILPGAATAGPAPIWLEPYLPCSAVSVDGQKGIAEGSLHIRRRRDVRERDERCRQEDGRNQESGVLHHGATRGEALSLIAGRMVESGNDPKVPCERASEMPFIADAAFRQRRIVQVQKPKSDQFKDDYFGERKSWIIRIAFPAVTFPLTKGANLSGEGRGARK